MPVILNLIKESLKPVTLGAEGGHAIAPVLPFLLHFSLSICLSEPIGALFLIQQPGFEREVGLSRVGFFYLFTLFFESKETSSSEGNT